MKPEYRGRTQLVGMYNKYYKSAIAMECTIKMQKRCT